MSKEGIPLQYDLFSRELVDTRSDGQKKKDRERITPQQMQMFKTPEIVQAGSHHPTAYKEWLSQATSPPLTLEIQDARTPEETERDRQREVEKLMTPMFGEATPKKYGRRSTAKDTPSGSPSGIIFDSAQHYCQRGFRARLRAQQHLLRRRA